MDNQISAVLRFQQYKGGSRWLSIVRPVANESGTMIARTINFLIGDRQQLEIAVAGTQWTSVLSDINRTGPEQTGFLFFVTESRNWFSGRELVAVDDKDIQIAQKLFELKFPRSEDKPLSGLQSLDILIDSNEQPVVLNVATYGSDLLLLENEIRRVKDGIKIWLESLHQSVGNEGKAGYFNLLPSGQDEETYCSRGTEF